MKPPADSITVPPLAAPVELTLVGTGHVFHIGPIVERIIAERMPDVVCVELDPVRLQGLQERRRLAELERAGDPRAQTIRRQHAEATKRLPIIYRFMARTQERLATTQGVEAGSEMLAAVDAAHARQIPIATIDVDAQRLIRRAWSEMRLKERLKFAWAMIRGQGSATMEEEMSQYQDDPIAYLAQVGEAFPTLKRVLIDERDAHMAKRILELPQHKHQLPGDPENVRVVAVVGDGHVGGMLRLLHEALPEETLEVIRVGVLRSGDLPPSPFTPRGGAATFVEADDSTSVSYQVDVPADSHYDPSP